MTVIIRLPETYRHDHFSLTVTETVEPGELTPDDVLAFEQMLDGSRRLRNRVRRLNAQTQPQ